MWYPEESSQVIALVRSDSNGVIKFETNWKKLLGVWIDRYESGKKKKLA